MYKISKVAIWANCGIGACFLYTANTVLGQKKFQSINRELLDCLVKILI
jgi:hypothetical protein